MHTLVEPVGRMAAEVVLALMGFCMSGTQIHTTGLMSLHQTLLVGLVTVVPSVSSGALVAPIRPTPQTSN